jgi:hypothetical protein
VIAVWLPLEKQYLSQQFSWNLDILSNSGMPRSRPFLWNIQKFKKYLNCLFNFFWYSSPQYVNQCWESESERKHKREKRKFMLVYAIRYNFMSSTRSIMKIFNNHCYVSRNVIRMFILLAKLLKTTVILFLKFYFLFIFYFFHLTSILCLLGLSDDPIQLIHNS